MDKTRRVCLALGLSLASFVFFPILVQAGVGVTPASLSFGSVPVNTTSPAASIVVTNGSRQSVSILKVSSTLPEFIVVSPAMPITLGPHSSTSFQVQFRPDAAISFSGSLVLNTSRRNGSTQSIAISGMGTAASSSSTQSYLLSSSASNMNFGNTLVGGATSQAIALTNTGTGSVNISQVAIVGAGFAVSSLPGAVTLPAGQSFTVTVSFAPTTAGSAVGNLSVVSSATNSPVMISLSGNGVQPQISVIPASVTFGSVTVGVVNTQALTISNTGTANLTITQMSLAGAGFSMGGIATPITLNPGQNTTLSAKFAPTSAGSASGSISVTSNATGSPLAIALSGTGTQAQLAPTPASVSFGSVAMGNTNTQTISLKNTGTASATISQANASGSGFSISGLTVPTTIAAGGSTTFNIAFSPASSSSVSGSVSLVNNGPSSPLAISLTGTGLGPTQSLGVSPTSLSFGNVQEGSSSSLGVTLTNNGNSNVTIASVTPTGAGFGATGVAAGRHSHPTKPRH